ncbi:MAG: RnfABCDGE type electron transport complex subunit D [Kiritimatiellia bacterium]
MSEETKSISYIVSSSPHFHSGASVRRIMLDVILALLPTLGMALWLFGWNTVRLVSLSVVSCVAFEYITRRIMHRDTGITDLSAVVTGLLLAFNLPPGLPSWMVTVGAFFAIVIAKQIFGGIGYNVFNPALVGRAALLISFPAQMTQWTAPRVLAPILEPARTAPDALTMATPLGWVKTSLAAGKGLPMNFEGWQPLQHFLLGFKPGCIGEVSAVAILLGSAYLFYRRCIYWQIPFFFLGSMALSAWILKRADPVHNMGPVFHLLTGGALLGALFMATDMVTSPVTRSGMMWFGLGCGILTMVIRKWGGYPEGVSFAILIMNSLTPLINRATRPKVFGSRKQKKVKQK